MIKRLITHIKRWNKWRKRCANGWLHKISVLFGGHSPTFNITLTDEELEELEQALIKAMKDTPVQILKDDYKELDDLVSDLAELFESREWYLSGDTGDGTWAEARDEFKAKWFTEHGRQQRIEKYLAEIRKEVLEMFGMNKGKCQNCVHWKRETEYYGRCKFNTCCLMHRSDSCEEKFEEREETQNE